MCEPGTCKGKIPFFQDFTNIVFELYLVNAIYCTDFNKTMVR